MTKQSHFRAGASLAPAERGQELVEFALTFPVLFMLLMGILDMGRATFYNSVLYNAAREGARYASIYPSDDVGIQDTVKAKAVGLDLNTLTIVTSMPDGDNIRVALTYQFAPITPIVASAFGASEVTVSNQATLRIED